METILDALEKLAAEGSTNEKKRILVETKSNAFAEIFKWAYNPFITFGVHKIDISDVVYTDQLLDDWYTRLEILLKRLSIRELTGNAAKAAVKHLLSKSTKRHAELIMNILKKDLRIGAGSRVINSVYHNLLPENFCMSAMKYDSKRAIFPVYADTKLDGVRCIAIADDKITLLSRNGKEFKNYSTIEEELKQLSLIKGMRLDGEITSGHFQDLMKTISRKEGGIELAKDAVYNIFDIQETEYKFDIRQKTLNLLARTILEKNLSHLKIVEGRIFYEQRALLDFYADRLAAGQEGVMVKTLNGKYEFKRSYAWQKMKPELSEDLQIVSVQEGTGKYKEQLGYVVCELENGNEVHVGSGFKDDERVRLWRMKDQLIGRLIEIKYQEKTRDGSLRFPIFKRFRPDKE